MGGIYALIDQVEKLSLMRYSKAHHGISCQSCHQSAHGMYPVAASGADPTTLEQARMLNPDKSAGPLKCAACHTVDRGRAQFGDGSHAGAVSNIGISDTL